MTAALTRELRALSRALLEIHSRILEIERRRDPEATAQEWLNHGELKRLLDTLPRESTNEAERLHARHQWTMRCKQAEDA
jgi:hypothetical protein